MKILFLPLITSLVMTTAALAQGASSPKSSLIPSSQEAIKPSSIAHVIPMIPATPERKVQIVVTDHGMNTDVSPQFTVYLAYASLAEMGNINADFRITNTAFRFLGATRKAAGHYEVKTQEYQEEGMFEVTYEIDATQMFIDERKQRRLCGDDFCDNELQTSVSVKRTEKKLN